MGQTKRKLETNHPGQQTRRSSVPDAKAQPDAKTLERMDFWSEAIQGLSAQEFETTEAAIEAVVDAVIAKFPGGFAEHKNPKEFLQMLLETDPGIELVLKKTLKIRG